MVPPISRPLSPILLTKNKSRLHLVGVGGEQERTNNRVTSLMFDIRFNCKNLSHQILIV